MSILKTTLVASALIFAGATTVAAQDNMMDKAKDMAVDKGADMAKDKAKESMGDDKAKYIDPAAKVGKKMLKGDSAKDAVMGAATSEAKSMGKAAVMGGVSTGGMTDTSLSTDEAVTAGKVMMKGGSAEDAAMAVAKDRAKAQMMDKAKDMMSTSMQGETSSAPMAPVAPAVMEAPATTVVVNCPAGTTAQSDGSCMITGDYKGQ